MNRPADKTGDWIEEAQGEGFALRYGVLGRLFFEVSRYQKVEILESAAHGKLLLNDGLVMLSERDEWVYHEMIAHVPLFVHPSPRAVLVIGGGDGGTVREVLRHDSVETCRLVEIDEAVIRACREHLPWTSAALDDHRVEVTVADGVEYAARTGDRYDLVIVDSTDPIGPAAPLFGRSFYRDVLGILRPGGMVVSQAESPYYEPDAQRSLVDILKGMFPSVYMYNYSNLVYPGGLWSFSFASLGPRPLADLDDARVAASGLSFRYYSPELHRAAFALPAYQSAALAGILSRAE